MWARSSAVGVVAVAFAQTAPAPKTAPSPPPKTTRGAVAVYEQACARCHGPNGSFYGPELGKGKTDAQLRQAVQEMADNQGQIELTVAEVDAETAYHRAIIGQQPFVCVVEQTKTLLRGEVSPGATVSVTVGGKPLKVTQTGFRWEVVLPALDSGPIDIVAVRRKATTHLDPAKATYSHASP